VVVSGIAFAAEVVEELLTARDGEAVAVSGVGGLRAWADKNGQQRQNLSVTIDRMLTVAAKPTAKAKHSESSKPADAQPLPPLPPGDLASLPSDLPFEESTS
jgi:single-stranded DNA-binding protein